MIVPKKITILDEQKIKWEGVTDFTELYKYMKLYLDDIGYANEKNLEQKYIERTKGDGKKQLEMAWHSEKKKSEFFKFNIDVTTLILGMSEVEVDQEGIKRKMQKGIFEMKISAYITTTDKWDELKGLHKLYYEMTIRKRIDEYKLELYQKSTGFHTYLKEFLGLRD